MKAVFFMMLVAIMGSTALVVRNQSLKRRSRQASVTPPTTDCICVEYNQCSTNYTLNKYGVTLIDIRRIGPCDHYLQVCCRKEDQITREAASSQPSTNSPLPNFSPSDNSLPGPFTTNNVSSSSLDNFNQPPIINNSLLVSSSTDNSSASSSTANSPLPIPSPSNSFSPLPASLLPNPSLTINLPNPSSTDNLPSPPPTGSPSFTSLPSNPLSNPSTTNNLPSPSSPEGLSPISLSPGSPNSSTTDPPVTEDADSFKTPPKVITEGRYQSRGCGFRNLDGVGFRIIGGKNEAQFGEFPWVVALLKDDEKFICGGSLIHAKVVLTSAHCVRGKFIKKLIARGGEWDRGTTMEVLPHQDRKIAEVIEHEHYHSGALLNDFALLILKEPMKLTDNVDTICLPSQDYNFDHSQCVASGWGKDDFNSKKDQVILKKVDLPIFPRNECESTLRKTRLGQYFELHDSFICAGGKKGQDTCTGDGGSPLMCPLKEDPLRYEQAGIVAWGIGCGELIPGVYANVARFRNWIDSELETRGITVRNS